MTAPVAGPRGRGGTPGAGDGGGFPPPAPPRGRGDAPHGRGPPGRASTLEGGSRAGGDEDGGGEGPARRGEPHGLAGCRRRVGGGGIIPLPAYFLHLPHCPP